MYKRNIRNPVLDKITNPKGEGAHPQQSDVWQGLTITYAEPLERYSYKEQFKKTSWQLLDRMHRHFRCYEFYPEFTDNGRIHYHGQYKSKSKRDTLKAFEEFRKKGFIKHERIKDHGQWYKYITKDIPATQDLIDRNFRIAIDCEEYDRRQNMMSKKRIRFEEVQSRLRPDSPKHENKL